MVWYKRVILQTPYVIIQQGTSKITLKYEGRKFCRAFVHAVATPLPLAVSSEYRLQLCLAEICRTMEYMSGTGSFVHLELMWNERGACWKHMKCVIHFCGVSFTFIIT